MEARKFKKLFKLYLLPVVLGVISIILFFSFFGYWNVLTGVDLLNFRVQLVATFLGVLLSIAIINSGENKRQYLRTKRIFGLLKLIAMPHLKNQAENIRDTMNTFNDMCSIEKSLSFLLMVSHFNTFSTSSDKNWMQLIYSQEFLDAPINDTHFNKIASAILEQLLFTKKLVACSSNANGLIGNPELMSEEQKKYIIQQAQAIRDDLHSSADILLRYVGDLDQELSDFLERSGAHYSEIER